MPLCETLPEIHPRLFFRGRMLKKVVEAIYLGAYAASLFALYAIFWPINAYFEWKYPKGLPISDKETWLDRLFPRDEEIPGMKRLEKIRSADGYDEDDDDN